MLVGGDAAEGVPGAAVVEELSSIGHRARPDDEFPEPGVPVANLLLGYTVSAVADPFRDAVHAHLHRDQDDVQGLVTGDASSSRPMRAQWLSWVALRLETAPTALAASTRSPSIRIGIVWLMTRM